MSTKEVPKQLIPFIDGRSLLQISMERLKGLVPEEQIYVCAGQAHKEVMLERLPGLTEERFIAEPMGRDTLNAVGLGTGVLGEKDPDAVVAVFTADHIIEPIDQFQAIVDQGYRLAETQEETLVTFGIAPIYAATGFGYLELGQGIGDAGFVVDEFKEKPEQAVAEKYVAAGAEKYLWNSGMFVWKASTLKNTIQSFAPENYAELSKIWSAWGSEQQDATLNEVFPTLKKISVDFAVMEPASQSDAFQVAAVPMPLTWLDVGSWPAYGETLQADTDGNEIAANHLSLSTKRTLVVSDDPKHLIATMGVVDLMVIHTPHATLICHKDEAQRIKEMHQLVGEKLGDDYL